MGLDCRIISNIGTELSLDRWYNFKFILDIKYNKSYTDVFTKEELSTIHIGVSDESSIWWYAVLGFVSAHEDGTEFMFLTDNHDDICSYDYKNEKDKLIEEFGYYSKRDV